MNDFWHKLKRPFTALAPLDGVTDVVFREIITEIGKPDVLFTEFTMVDGLLSERGRAKVEERLYFKPEQQPVVAQIWGTKPENFYKVAQEVKARGFAGVDINMGCPDRTVIKDGACSGLIKNPALATEIIQATKEGAGGLPVSVKTRIGFDKESIDEWISHLLQQDLAVLTVHLRTVAELSKVDAHWELMPKVMELRNKLAPHTLIVGNGDIKSLEETNEKHEKFGTDGFMVGRGVFANPWLFDPTVDHLAVPVNERINLYLRHIRLFEQTWGKTKNFALLKKFAKTYINNFPDASAFRESLMQARTMEELTDKLQGYLTVQGATTTSL